MGEADSSHNPATNCTQTQEVSGPEGPFRRQPQGIVDSEQYFRSLKGDIVSVMLNNHIDVSHVTKLIEDCAHSTQSTLTATALQWAQQNLLILNTSLGNNLSTAAGHLHLAVPNWMKVTSDPWVINTIQGYKIEFWAQPQQIHPPTLHFSQKDTHLMTTEVHKLLQKEAISVVLTTCTKGFLSRIFLVPKKDGLQRPDINLR